MKLCLVGPTHPFRGGISHYMTLLGRALATSHDITFISFKRQYPRLLFPGASDRDPSSSPIMLPNVEYIIDSLNPWTWFKAFRRIQACRPEIIIFSWWVAFWAPQFWLISLLVKHFLRCERIFICHNAVEHESNCLKKLATRITLSQADRIITHSREETMRLHDLLGEHRSITTAFHPTYAGMNGGHDHSREQARTILGVSGDVLLFFGFVRRYKGLDVLLEALPLILKERKVTLLIAGEFWNDTKEYLDYIEHHDLQESVRIIDRYIPNEETGLYFAAADIVVQPYRTASGSGVCQLAFGFDRPVVATAVGSLPEVVQDGINGRIVPPGDARALARAVIESLDPDVKKRYTLSAAQTKTAFSWERMTEIITG